MSVRTDETGLHAEDCACLLCETGFRPTPEQRAVARRAHWQAEEAKRRLLAKAAEPQPVARLSHTVRPMTRVPPPMTPEELAALRADVEAFRKGGKNHA